MTASCELQQQERILASAFVVERLEAVSAVPNPDELSRPFSSLRAANEVAVEVEFE